MAKRKNNKKQLDCGNTVTTNKRSIPNKITASTDFTFSGKKMTPFGGMFALSSLVEKIQLDKLIESTLTVDRKTKFDTHKYILAIIFMLYMGYERLAHFMYLHQDSFFIRILGMSFLPVQSTFWRFMNESLHKHNEHQLQIVNFKARQRIWDAAHVNLQRIHLDIDPTTETVYGKYDGAKKGYNPGHRGRKSFRPFTITIAQTNEIIGGKLRAGETITGKEVARQLKLVLKNLPGCVKHVVVRADSEMYCKELAHECENYGCDFILSVKKNICIKQKISEITKWKYCPDNFGVAEFLYEPTGWGKKYRFLVSRYEKDVKEKNQQTDMFDDEEYKYRVFVTGLKHSAKAIIKEYDGRAGTENIIEEAKNQVAMAKIPGRNFITNSIYLQLVFLAFNLNRWLQLIGRDEEKEFKTEEMNTSRFKHLYLACKVADSQHQTNLRFDEGYGYKEHFYRLMERIRSIVFSCGKINEVLSRNLIPRYSQ